VRVTAAAAAAIRGHEPLLHLRQVCDHFVVAPDDQEQILDEFYRVDSSRDRKSGGYGLGLAIAQQIARAHQGQIVASSIVGEGSRFRLTLPGNGRSAV
jgi:signal transduction histidine kinase